MQILRHSQRLLKIPALAEEKILRGLVSSSRVDFFGKIVISPIIMTF
jgi:hypothetical protein